MTLKQSSNNKNTEDGWLVAPNGWNIYDDIHLINIKHDDIINDDLTHYKENDVILLAGGLDPEGYNHPWVKDRLDAFLKLYSYHKRNIYILGGGTYHKPPHLNKQGYVIHESTMGAKYLIENGVDPNHIKREWASYDTIANAFFSLTCFVIPKKEQKIKELLIITSDFHMKRTILIFKWLYSMWDTNIKLNFLSVKTTDMKEELYQARSQKEEHSITNLLNIIKNIKNLEQFIDWFYQDHKAYNCDFAKNLHYADNTTINNELLKNTY